ncbi:MAG: radical SAM family heme chaperone HemW [Candidatus Gastranaerophilales bacterium]|nr:radical SAM family heme chaperone HemW [Candidatus Gastranaerophilales bacterium]
MGNMIENIYIHIPFCLQKCNYCSFVSFDGHKNKEKDYINSLIKEIKYFSNKKNIIKTVYFGGGTPNILEIENFKNIITALNSAFNIAENAEITTEINPAISSAKYFKELKRLGINRISVGSQTFNDDILKNLGRKHNAKQTTETVEALKDCGFNNISVDLMYGLPNQTMEILQRDLDIIKSLDINHVSTYGLKIEEGCAFYSNMPDNLPDDDKQEEFYLKIVDELTQAGFEHYEISNFAKKGFESKHNNCYWEAKEYYGFGLAAHSYMNKTRYSNEIDLEMYINNPLTKITERKITKGDELEESIFLGFRLKKGIDIKAFNEKFGKDFMQDYKKQIEKLVELDLMKVAKDRVFLTTKGFLLSNSVISEFL